MKLEEYPSDRGDMTRSETAAWDAAHTPISLCWENLSWQIATNNRCRKKNQKPLKILKNLNGCVKPGEMLAIIGGL
jgi:ABC-type glutathione transport system ATPase component